MPREAENLVGRRFGTRKVFKRAESRDYGGYKVIYWKVKCLCCGDVAEVQGSSLKRGAGCQKCRGVAPKHKGRPPSKQQRAAAKRATATQQRPVTRSRKQLTVRDVMRMLSELPENSLMYVHLVGKDGHATRRVKDVSAIRGHVMLVAELPKKIEPWKG